MTESNLLTLKEIVNIVSDFIIDWMDQNYKNSCGVFSWSSKRELRQFIVNRNGGTQYWHFVNMSLLDLLNKGVIKKSIRINWDGNGYNNINVYSFNNANDNNIKFTRHSLNRVKSRMNIKKRQLKGVAKKAYQSKFRMNYGDIIKYIYNGNVFVFKKSEKKLITVYDYEY